ncbi:MAG TPA: aminotransferase class IV, partial [Acidobacteriota bacterium]|nr:aminotransferase class IV [Acidobacteriota bacterium]
RDNGWVTPPLECGLLAGTMRHRLLSRGTICEAPVKVEELCCDPSRLRVVNSVRGILRVSRIRDAVHGSADDKSDLVEGIRAG